MAKQKKVKALDKKRIQELIEILKAQQDEEQIEFLLALEDNIHNRNVNEMLENLDLALKREETRARAKATLEYYAQTALNAGPTRKVKRI